MAVIENRFVCDLSKPVQAQALKGNVFSLDNLGSRLSVLIYDNGQPATISGSITANCILPDGSTVNVNGGLTTENGGSKAYVDIPQSCLLIHGILKIAIKCTSSSVITTLAAIVANVYMTKTDNVITPSQQIITDWNAEISASLSNQDAKISGLKSALTMEKNLVYDQTGYDVPYFEIGTIAFGSGSIVYQNYTTGIRTPLGQEIPVKAGDIVGLTDYEGYQFKYAVKKSNNTYEYSAYRQTNATIANDGLLYVVIQTTDAAVQTSVEPLGNLCRIKRKDSLDLQSAVKALQDRATTDENHLSDREDYLQGMLERDIMDEYVMMKRGQYSIGSSAIIENASTSRIIIKSPVRILPGDTVGLWDYTGAQYRYAVKRDSDSKFDFSSNPITVDTIVANSGVLYVEVSKQSGDIADNEIETYSALVKIRKTRNNILADTKYGLMSAKQYQNILANGKFLAEDFGRGECGSANGYAIRPTSRTYRCANVFPFYLYEDYTITADSGYRFYSIRSTDGGLTWSPLTWQTSYTFAKGTLLGIEFAKVTEDTTSQADVAAFVSHYTITTPLKTTIEEGATVTLSADTLAAIETHMAHFYDSNVADSYVFFTDPHLMGTNGTFNERTFKLYMDTLKAVTDRITNEYVISGGDWLTSGDTKAKASMKLGFVDGQMNKYFGEKYLPIVGNHDFNYLGVDGSGNRLDSSDWISNDAMRNFMFENREHCYYSVKTICSTIYILNTRTDYDGVADYDKTMLDWFAARLIEDDPAHSSVMFHIYYLNYSQQTIPNRVGCIGKIIAEFNGHTTCTLTAATDGYDKTYDFSGCTGKVHFSMVGHSHADFNTTFGGVPLIGVDNMQGDGEPTFDLVFADYTHGKLYCTRVGTGSDRTFDI